jgi:adenylate cyclase
MAAAGLPVPVADHALRSAKMALEILAAVADFNLQTNHNLQVRIGIDTGAVVAGVIGRRKFLYDLWGDVVNTASRMESCGVAGRIHISDAMRRQLDGLFEMECRGEIEVKGRGQMTTWFLNGPAGGGR